MRAATAMRGSGESGSRARQGRDGAEAVGMEGNGHEIDRFHDSRVGLSALALSGCNNGLNQPKPGQTPMAAQVPGPNAAGAPLVPANNPNDPVPITPPNQRGSLWCRWPRRTDITTGCRLHHWGAMRGLACLPRFALTARSIAPASSGRTFCRSAIPPRRAPQSSAETGCR
jgi:hypothetical protein